MINGNSFDSSYALLNNLKFVENLNELNMNELKIGDEGLKELSKSFKYLKNLEFLHLNNNRITAAGIENMKEFSMLTNLKELNLSNNLLKAEGCSYLKFNKNLEVLNLWANDIRVEGVKNLLSNIRSDFNLREISFSQNNIDDKEKNGKADGMIFILKTVTNDLLNVKNINFSSNYLNQSSFYNLIYYYPIIKSRRIYLNICDCPSHSDLNNGVKGEFEKLSKDDGLVKFSI
jgi:Ran GTPase-activating protein (RanGAP) involved in mRNA processing and transport